MYALIDTFNKRMLSKHRTLRSAAKADIKHHKKADKSNGKDSRTSTTVKRVVSVRNTLLFEPLSGSEHEELVRTYTSEGD